MCTREPMIFQRIYAKEGIFGNFWHCTPAFHLYSTFWTSKIVSICIKDLKLKDNLFFQLYYKGYAFLGFLYQRGYAFWLEICTIEGKGFFSPVLVGAMGIHFPGGHPPPPEMTTYAFYTFTLWLVILSYRMANFWVWKIKLQTCNL